MIRPNLIGARWNSDRLEVNLQGMSTFVQYTKPSIPGIEFDTFLHYEPGANITEYVHRGKGLQMTDEQIEACAQYFNQMDFPGFAYDPLRYNVYMGIKTTADAKALGLKLVYVPIETDLCKFNEDSHTWETVHAIICEDGIPFMNFTNNFNSKDTTPRPCVADMQTSVLLLTKEEWNVISKTRIRPQDIYDFKTHSWKDNRVLEEELELLADEITTLFDSWKHGYKYKFLGGMGPEDLEWLARSPDKIDEYVAVIEKYSKTINYPLEYDEIKRSILKAMDDLEEFKVLSKEIVLEVLTFQVSIKSCKDIESLDTLRTAVFENLAPRLDIYKPSK